MRLLHAPTCYAPVLGGAETHCRRLSEALAARGHDVSILTANVAHPHDLEGPPLLRGIARAREGIGGLEVRRIEHGGDALRWIERLRWLPLPGRGMLRRRLKRSLPGRYERLVERTIHRARADAVLTMAHASVHVRSVAAAHRRRPFPLVMVPLLHDDDPWVSYEAQRAVLDEADAVVANTRHEAARLTAEFGVPPARVVVGSLGVDVPAAPGPEARAPHVLFLGRKSIFKGLGLLIEAMRRVWALERPAGVRARLVLAGARWNDSAQVDDLVAALPPEERARVDSPYDVSEAEKARLLSQAACLVLPSRLESFGLVLLEAWSHATPVVTLDLPVFRCTVTHGADGLLVPPDRPDALAAAICSLLLEPAHARALGRAGRAHVEAHGSWDHVAARYEQAYALAREHHARRRDRPVRPGVWARESDVLPKVGPPPSR
jgi:glycosyltransferase involved in cell wall biosynthesis